MKSMQSRRQMLSQLIETSCIIPQLEYPLALADFMHTLCHTHNHMLQTNYDGHSLYTIFTPILCVGKAFVYSTMLSNLENKADFIASSSLTTKLYKQYYQLLPL